MGLPDYEVTGIGETAGRVRIRVRFKGGLPSLRRETPENQRPSDTKATP
jgi:hypothetical protein